MKQDWQDKIAASNAEMQTMLGNSDARMRCAARFGIAVTEPLNAWYADELARGTNGAVLLEVLPRCIGQILGIVVFNQGGHPVVANSVLQIAAIEMAGTLDKARAGAMDEMKVRNPGAKP